MFFHKKLDKEGPGNHEINMTPLIDVSLVLVVMLLLATPLALESSIAVRNARKSSRTAKKEKIEERIELAHDRAEALTRLVESAEVNIAVTAHRSAQLASRDLKRSEESRQST